jgi:hypothetical protein
MASAKRDPVRATVTNRVAPSETTKLLGVFSRKTRAAILPAATNELDLNGPTPYVFPINRETRSSSFGIDKSCLNRIRLTSCAHKIKVIE